MILLTVDANATVEIPNHPSNTLYVEGGVGCWGANGKEVKDNAINEDRPQIASSAQDQMGDLSTVA